MRVGITGGTGFVGQHLAASLLSDGHEVVLVARGVRRLEPWARGPGVRVVAADVGDPGALDRVFDGCHAVAHLAGINRQRGAQTFERVHVQGTRLVVEAARAAGVRRLVFVSFLRARAGSGCAYLDSKWLAEQCVQGSGMDFTIVKAGLMYGRGDHMLAHLSWVIRRLHALALVGLRPRAVRPVDIQDAVLVLRAALVEGRLAGRTVSLIGPEAMNLGEAARRVARAMRSRLWTLRLPVIVHLAMAWLQERAGLEPLASTSQVRLLAEGIAEPLPECETLPEDLSPASVLGSDTIMAGLPAR